MSSKATFSKRTLAVALVLTVALVYTLSVVTTGRAPTCYTVRSLHTAFDQQQPPQNPIAAHPPVPRPNPPMTEVVPSAADRTSPYSFTNLNSLESTHSAKDNEERVLVLTPLKDAVPYLDRYFELLNRTTYPNHLMDVGFLVSDSTDDTVSSLEEHAEAFQQAGHPFHDVKIFRKDFNFEMPPLERHKFEYQPVRRSIMARSRNTLLSAALTDDVSWVAWVDVDVIEYPETIFEDLMSLDKDIVVPNCFLWHDDPKEEPEAYDRNNWQETKTSVELQKHMSSDFVLAEGYEEILETGRNSLADMPTEFGLDYAVPLDGVGATFTLVK